MLKLKLSKGSIFWSANIIFKNRTAFRLKVPKIGTNYLLDNKWINRHIASCCKKSSSFRNATEAFSSALCCGPCWSVRDFHWCLLPWQETKKSHKIIKENWRKTGNEEWGNNYIRAGKAFNVRNRGKFFCTKCWHFSLLWNPSTSKGFC